MFGRVAVFFVVRCIMMQLCQEDPFHIFYIYVVFLYLCGLLSLESSILLLSKKNLTYNWNLNKYLGWLYRLENMDITSLVLSFARMSPPCHLMEEPPSPLSSPYLMTDFKTEMTSLSIWWHNFFINSLFLTKWHYFEKRAYPYIPIVKIRK